MWLFDEPIGWWQCGNTNLVVQGLVDVGGKLPIGDIERAKGPLNQIVSFSAISWVLVDKEIKTHSTL